MIDVMKLSFSRHMKALQLMGITFVVFIQCTNMQPIVLGDAIDERWTVGIYMESSLGANSLAEYIERDLNEIRRIRSTANNLTIVALVHAGEDENSRNLNELSLHTFTFNNAGDVDEVIWRGAQALNKIGLSERYFIYSNWLDDTEVFDKFLDYVGNEVYSRDAAGVEIPEARRGDLAFTLWGHGDGATGFFQINNKQDLVGKPPMSIENTARAFADFKTRSNVASIDSIIIDACSMAHIEFADALAEAGPVADYLASSQEYVNANGLHYQYFFEYFLAKGSDIPSGVSRLAASAYQAYKDVYMKYSLNRQETYSVIDLTNVQFIKNNLEDLQNSLANDIFDNPNEENQRAKAFVESLFDKRAYGFPRIWPHYDANGIPDFRDPLYLQNNISLSGFAEIYKASEYSDTIQNAAAALFQAVENSMALRWVHPGLLGDYPSLREDNFGISVSTFARALDQIQAGPSENFPDNENKFRLCYYESTAVGTQTQHWYEFQNFAYLEGQNPNPWWNIRPTRGRTNLLSATTPKITSNYCTP